MNKILFGAGLLMFAGLALFGYAYLNKQHAGVIAETPVSDFRDATYVIDGKSVTLKNGVSEVEAAPGSASKIVTKYFGNEVRHDLDGDGTEDVAFILTQQTGGSGTFYYVVASLNRANGFVGTQGFLLGDRIAPQTTEMGTGTIVIVNYADRKAGEDFSVPPSVGKSVWLFLDKDALQFGEVEQDFEGEADPAKMSLGMKSWTWIRALGSDGKEVLPKQTMAFTLDILGDGKFSATTDCNRLAGDLATKGTKISFSNMISTKMFCEGSQESFFSTLLGDTDSYQFTSKGELILTQKGGGTATFR